MTEGMFKNKIHEFMIDRATRSANFDMGESHYHPYYELYYLLSGHSRLFINHTIYYVAPGDIILITPSALHKAFYGDSKKAERFTVNFTPDYVRSFCESCLEEEFCHIFSQVKLSIPSSLQPSVHELLVKMEQESRISDRYSPIQIKSLLFQFLVFLGRCQNQKQTPQFLEQGDSAIQEAAHYIYNNRRESLSLQTAAKAAHMSPTYFSKRFKEATGFGFKEYLTYLRIQDGEHLLRTTNLSVTEIGVTCGFSDGNYFGDAFKKATGLSPKQFRKTLSEPISPELPAMN